MNASSNNTNTTSRRDFLKNTGRLAAASALAGVALPAVHAAEDNTIQVALIGCGGRGTGAAANAMSVKRGPVKLVAMADVFQDRLDGSYSNLKRNPVGDQVDVPDERQFIGFDGYQKPMDCLKPGDIAIFTTPLAFRWVHFHLRHQEGAERLHGEAAHGRRPDLPPHDRSRQTGHRRRISRWAWA